MGVKESMSFASQPLRKLAKEAPKAARTFSSTKPSLGGHGNVKPFTSCLTLHPVIAFLCLLYQTYNTVTECWVEISEQLIIKFWKLLITLRLNLKDAD